VAALETMELEGAARILRPRDHGNASTSPNMTWHGGPVLGTTQTGAVFWGPSWASSTFAADKITGIDRFYGGFGGSDYAKTSDEYGTPVAGAVTSTVTYGGHVMDASHVSRRAPKSPAIIVSKVCADVPNVVANGFYAVYTDVPRAGAGFCAWHSYGTCPNNGTTIQVAFMFDLDGDPGCDPGNAVKSVSQGLAAIANVSAHELSEARTDPLLNAWYDASGDENGDKCAWTFLSPYVTLSNGSQWTLQAEWSNAAYLAGTGSPNRSGQKGCVE
jgi:hypothetical protein